MKDKSDTRYCNGDEIWVCQACGKWAIYDSYNFNDVSCMLNAVKVKRGKCHFSSDNSRVIKVD